MQGYSCELSVEG